LTRLLTRLCSKMGNPREIIEVSVKHHCDFVGAAVRLCGI
jgi:hypothetical protein